jgi:C4-dicarboxylate transporter DctM subunit
VQWYILLLLLFLILFLFLIPGCWIAVSLGLTGIIGLLYIGQYRYLSSVSEIGWNTSNNFIMTAVPLFLFMGELILRSGLSKKFYISIGQLLHRIPGNLLHTNIIACAIFSALSGSSIATAAAIGSIAIPQMKEEGYEKKLIYGSLAAGGTLGILIPPSISLILYGAMTEQSVVKLFTAGIIPGIVLTILFLFYTGYRSLKDSNAMLSSKKTEFSFFEIIKNIFPFFTLILMVLGSIYGGYATPTEAAAIGAIFAIFFGFIFGNLSYSKVLESLQEAVKTTSMIMFIMIGAQIFSFSVLSLGINRHLITWVTASFSSPYTLLFVVYIIYIILGCFIDGNSIVFLTVPLLYPLVINAGFDPIWFGIAMVILIELGLITPPLGLNLFIIDGIDKEATLNEIIQGSIPYMIIMLVMLAILTIFPRITHILL